MNEPGAPIVDPYAVAPKTSGHAIASVVLSALGFVCLPAIGGLLGVVFGIAAKGEIEKSRGKSTGGALATAGVALGAANIIVSVLGIAGFVSWLDTLDASPAAPTPIVATAAPPPTLHHPPLPSKPPRASTAATKRGGMSRESGVVVTRVGRLTLVSVDSDVRSLRAELGRQAESAEKSSEKLVLWMVSPDCHPCNGVAASLSDPLMQEALAGVRLVRVDVRDFAVELSYLGVPVQKIPGFALLGPDQRPVDYVHGGEWDDDVAKNIAPVLGKFVIGKYEKRREPWRGGAREDETAL